jgi:divalent metal cation (Fe/Co/Zn/Cd) transporter
MKSFVTAIASLATGYLVGAVGGYAAVQSLSSNTHDRAVEAAMTGAFVTGPLIAVLALVGWAFVNWFRRSRKPV